MRKCLQQAENLLDKEAVPTAATVETVRGLVDTAIEIDEFAYGLIEETDVPAGEICECECPGAGSVQSWNRGINRGLSIAAIILSLIAIIAQFMK